MSKAKQVLDSINEKKEELRSHLPKGFVAFTGVKFADSQVKEYNRLQDKINGFIKDGKPVPDDLLNSSHKLFSMFSARS